MTACYLPAAEYRRLLTRRRAEILALQRVPAVERQPDAMDEAIEQAAANVQFSRLASFSTELHLINEAFERLDNNEYGVCTRCDTPIQPKRLNAVPWAKRCAPCQEFEDARQRDAQLPEFAAEA